MNIKFSKNIDIIYLFNKFFEYSRNLCLYRGKKNNISNIDNVYVKVVELYIFLIYKNFKYI